MLPRASFVAGPEELAALVASLAEKYRVIEALRRDRRETGEVAPDQVLATLAARFPGALRELDDLADDVIATRLAELDAVRRGQLLPLPWMTAQAAFHAVARGALAAKRWLGGRKDVHEATRAAFRDAVDRGALPEEAALVEEQLHEVARPPRGRVLAVVYARVEALTGIPAAEVRRLVRGGGLRASTRAR